MKRLSLLAPLLAAALLGGCGGSDDDGATAAASVQASTIARVAQDRGFTALLAAAAKAGLAPALGDAGTRVTVFAPTNAAFDALAKNLGFADATAMVAALPPDALKSILGYHLVNGTKSAADLSASATSSQDTSYSFDGKPAALSVAATGGVKITDAALTTASVVAADVQASNGVIHAIDKVLVPPGVLNIVQMAQVNPNLSSLVSAVTAANLQGTLSGTGPFTVFAPTNAAFAAAPSGLTPQQLTTVLTYHVLGSQVLSSQIPFGTPVSTVAGQSITITAGTPPTIMDKTSAAAKIVATDVRASNGVVHVIDKVLIPQL